MPAKKTSKPTPKAKKTPPAKKRPPGNPNIAKYAFKPNDPGTGFKDPRINRKGRPKESDLLKDIIKEIFVEDVRYKKEYSRRLETMPRLRAMLIEMARNDTRGKIELLDRVFGKSDLAFEDDTELDGQFQIPAELLAPSFVDIYHDIRNRRHTEYIARGGRGSTKSSFFSEVIIELIINNPNMHALITRQVGNTLRDSVFSQIRWAIMEMRLEHKFKVRISPLQIEYLPTGQVIYFRGGDDPVKIKSIKPTFGYIGILWFEELDQFRGPEVVRNIEQSAIRGGDLAYIFKSFNPPRTSANWANKYCKIPKEKQYQHFSNYLGLPEKYFADDKYRKSVDPDLIQYMIDRMRVPTSWLGTPWLDEAEHLKKVNPMAYNHEYGGIPTGTGGLVFENTVIRKITDKEIKTFGQAMEGIDWGYFPDPFAWGRSYYDPNRMILYIFDEYVAKKMSNRRAFNYLKKNKGLDANNLIIADSAEPKSIGDFKEWGANIRGAEKGPESVNYSMKWLQSLNQIVIDGERCPHHADEFLNYELEKDKNDEFISAYPDKNNHCIDEIRYAHNLIWRRRGQ